MSISLPLLRHLHVSFVRLHLGRFLSGTRRPPDPAPLSVGGVMSNSLPLSRHLHLSLVLPQCRVLHVRHAAHAVRAFGHIFFFNGVFLGVGLCWVRRHSLGCCTSGTRRPPAPATCSVGGVLSNPLPHAWALCVMCGSFVSCVGALYHVWELCIMCVSFVSCVGALYNVRELCIMCGGFV